MNILSIHTGHNATIAYFENGVCERILHEEKYNNIKNYTGFPFKALSQFKSLYPDTRLDIITLCETEHLFINTQAPEENINIYEKATHFKVKDIYRYAEYKTGLKTFFSPIRDYVIRRKVAPRARAILKQNIKNVLGFDNDNRIVFSDHHLNHALSPVAFYGLGQHKDPILLFTLDGAGDYFCSKLYRLEDGKLSLISKTDQDASIGLIYARVTKFLGMKMNEHEHKVMGLAAYVKDNKYFQHIADRLKHVLWFDKETLTFQSKFNTNTISPYLKKYFSDERFDNIAAGLQKFTEDLVLDWINSAIQKTGIKAIALSGGVFMNVKLNQKILFNSPIEKVFIQPSCGDESLVLGAPQNISMSHNKPIKPVNTMLLGADYTNEEVSEYIEQANLNQRFNVTCIPDIELKIAELLADNKIVARFKGRGEWGARSLCHRAILGNGSKWETFFEINNIIKKRDFWMPFAPTVLEEWADQYIYDWETLMPKCLESSRYMIITFKATELAQKHLRAAMHQTDKTIRPQIINQDDGDTYNLLKHFEKLTNMGGLLNTSLNLHGYPLVGTIDQAIFTFENSGLEYMAIENFLIQK